MTIHLLIRLLLVRIFFVSLFVTSQHNDAEFINNIKARNLLASARTQLDSIQRGKPPGGGGSSIIKVPGDVPPARYTSSDV